MSTPNQPNTGEPIQDVIAPGAPESAAEQPIAAPPKGVKFTEVTEDPVVAPAPEPVEPPIEPDQTTVEEKLEPTTEKTIAPVVVKQPKLKKEPGNGKPIGVIVLAIILFVALSAAAYYAYSKTS